MPPENTIDTQQSLTGGNSVYINPLAVITTLVDEAFNKKPSNYCKDIIIATALMFYYNAVCIDLSKDNEPFGGVTEMEYRKRLPVVGKAYVKQAVKYYEDYVLPVQGIKKIPLTRHFIIKIIKLLGGRLLAFVDAFLIFAFVSFYAKDFLIGTINFFNVILSKL